MKWHIITSNKGGVGKTLLSLMLLLSFLKDERGKVALVVDLNGMNPDLRWLLGTKIHEIKVKDLGVEGKPFPLNYQSINFTKMDNHSGQWEGVFILGWSQHPYTMLCGGQNFFNLLNKIKEIAIENNVDTIIIDTNFHFCNVFTNDKSLYEEYEIFKEEEFLIWFIWVFRQMLNLMINKVRAHIGKDLGIEDEMFFDVVDAIESKMNSAFCEKTPFVHVFNTATVSGALNDVHNTDLADWLPSWLSGKQKKVVYDEERGFYRFMQMEHLANADSLESIKFAELVRCLGEKMPKPHGNIHTVFLETLEKYSDSVRGCPRNIFPIFKNYPTLSGFTDEIWDSEGKVEDNTLIKWLIESDDGLLPDFRKCLNRLLKKANY